MIISGKSFYDQVIDSDIKQFEEIKKLPTVQGVKITLFGACYIMIAWNNIIDF